MSDVRQIEGACTPRSPCVCVDTRVLSSVTTGVQRYLRELLVRLPQLVQIEPTTPLLGVRGHWWEQACLPMRLHRRLLWSPSNTGPLCVRNQVVTIHDLAPLDHPEWMNRRFAEWYRFLIPHLVRRVRHVIVVSEFTRERLVARTHVDGAKVSVVYPGFGRHFAPQTPDAVMAMRRKLALPEGRYVLSVGSLEPRKNLGRLLLAWNALLPKLPSDVYLLIVGAKGTRRVFSGVPELEHLPLRVILLGYVADGDLPPLYAGASVFVFPSLYEGFGSPPLEAMACGVPVVVGNQASLPEVVGDAALMVDPHDVSALARAVMSVIAKPELAARLGAEGPVRAQRFSYAKAAQETWRILAAVEAGRQVSTMT